MAPNDLHALATHGTWLVYQMWIKQPILLWDITTNTQNVWQSVHNYSNVVQIQMLFYKHEQHIVPDRATKYEQNHHILLCNITTNSQSLFKNGHNYSELRQSQILFYMPQLPIVPDYGTQYEEYPSNHHGGMWEDEQTDR